MSADENIQLMRRWFQEVWNEGRMETIYELLSPDGVAHTGKGARRRALRSRRAPARSRALAVHRRG